MTTSAVFRPSTPGDQAELALLLGRIFNVEPAADQPFVRADHMKWKYWQPFPGWEGSRSYVLEQDSALVAHGAVWPLRLLTPAGSLSATYLFDWAADPAHRGAGRALFYEIANLSDVICTLGGTAIMRRIRGSMGFRPANTVHSFLRVIKPVNVGLAVPRSWKTPIRLLRTMARTWPLPRQRPGWQADEVTAAEMETTAVPFPRPRGLAYVLEQSAARIGFLASCPSVQFRFYVVRHLGSVVGYFIMRYGSDSARLIDAWAEDGMTSWCQTYALATRMAAEHSSAPIIATIAPDENTRRALEAVRYRSSYKQDLHLYDPRHQVPQTASLHYQLVHADFAFL